MRKADVEIGAIYTAKISNKMTMVQILEPSGYGGWRARNLDTGRTVRIKSAMKLREKVE
jgi:hypothetical protein